MDFWQNVGATLLGGAVPSVVFTALVGAWFTIQMEKLRNKQSAKLEEVKTALSAVLKLQALSVERQAGIAAQVLVATLRYLDALKGSVSGFVQVPRKESDTPASAREAEFQFRWAALKPFEKGFADAWIQAEIHLPQDAIAILAEASDCGRDIFANQMTHLTMLYNGETGDPTCYRNSFGSIPNRRIQSLRETAIAKLRPLVKLQLQPAIDSATDTHMGALNARSVGVPAR